MDQKIKRFKKIGFSNPLWLACILLVIKWPIINCQNVKPPTVWTEHWFEHVQNVTRVYFDDHVAGYLDPDVDPRVRWPFEYLSKVWLYVKNTFGQFGSDPRVYVILHAGKYNGGHASTVFRSDHDFRNVIDFGQLNRAAWTTPNVQSDIESLISVAGFIVEGSSKGTDGSPAWPISGYKWNDIFMYDVLLNTGMAQEAKSFLNEKMTDQHNSPREGTFWMRDWFWPIYRDYGGPGVLDLFFANLYFHFPRGLKDGSRTDFEYKGSLNMGEFVHFWSGAAGVNLRDLARTAFGWTMEYQEKFVQARTKYPGIRYPCSDCDNMPTTRTSTTPPTTNSTTTQMPEPTKDWTTLIIIAVCTAVFFLIVIIFVAALTSSHRKIRTLRKQIRELTFEEITEFYKGQDNDGQPDNGQEEEGNASFQSMPYDTKYELSPNQLVIEHKQVLGSGQFGLVIRGVLNGIEEKNNMAVAIKTVKPDVDVEYFKAFLMELKIMAYLGKHKNIVTFLGACTANIKNREIYVALELCDCGDLRKYLLKNAKHFKNLFSSFKRASSRTEQSALNTITTFDLLQWSRNIASGMMFLTEKRVIHGDLAARNVLLTANKVAKISDFGLSRQLLYYSTYSKQSKTPLPWRWMALESLKYMKFSPESDIWAFGVTLWEIFSLGEVPYPGKIWDHDFVDKIDEGDRLKIPKYANDALYGIMFDCWKTDPKERPTFFRIHELLSSQIQDQNLQNNLWRGNGNNTGPGWARNQTTL